MTSNVLRVLSLGRSTKRKAWLIVAALLLGMAPAFAGDRAQANTIGFSDDGRYFAYEQYGIMDGSGSLYSDVFILDLMEDKWLKDVPFSARAEDGARSLADTRAAAVQAAQPLLNQYGISNPVFVGALNGDGVLDANGEPADGKILHFGQPFYAGIQHDYTLALSQLDADNSATCTESADGPYQGFALTLTDNETKTTRELHRDPGQQPLPASRGCALSYSIYAIVYPLESEGDPVALISIYTQGFEGLDRRFMAVPLGTL